MFFGLIFTPPDFFFAIYDTFCGFLCYLFGSGWGGDELGSILSFCTLCVFAFFGRFWHLLAFFWHFLGFSGDLGILIVLVNYEVTKEIILVVGRVTDEFWGVQGGFGWVWGGLDGPV